MFFKYSSSHNTNNTNHGLLSSFLLTLSGEFLTDYLTAHDYSTEHIYWINQIVRGMLVVSMGGSLGLTIATPLASYFLAEYVGVSREKANIIAMGTLMAAGLFASPSGWVESTLTMAVGMSTNLAANKMAQYASQWIQHGFFKHETRKFIDVPGTSPASSTLK